MKLSEELTWRGLVNQTTYKDLNILDDKPIAFYWGVDPSAPSMTIGNLAAAMVVKQFMKAGHKAYLLIGGATGMIGDPDGKAQERDLKTVAEVSLNKNALAEQYKRIFDGLDFHIVDNLDWFKEMNYLQFLRDVGKHVPMRQMMARDFVQTRLAEDGAGISYAEFSYVLIQGYDFVHLNKQHDVTLQLCGSDQWGNSIAGVDLIRRINGQESHVFSTPLVVNKATGKKFGKTEDGAIWLDEKLTSPFKFYQFWLNVDDDGVEEYIKIYTELDKTTVEKLMNEFNDNKAGRAAQKALAYEVTQNVHGQRKAEAVQKVSNVLFGQEDFSDLTSDEKELLSAELPTVTASEDLYQTLVDATLASSKSEARTFHNNGAVSVNGQKIEADQSVSWQPGLNLIKRGKNSFALAKK